LTANFDLTIKGCGIAPPACSREGFAGRHRRNDGRAVFSRHTHAYIHSERMRRDAAGLTFPTVRAVVEDTFNGSNTSAPRTVDYIDWIRRLDLFEHLL